MTQPCSGLERRTLGEHVGRRACIRAAWEAVRVESVDYDGRDVTVRAWARLGVLAPVDVLVELVTASCGGCRMWCVQSYRNGSFLFTAGVACLGEGVERSLETWAVCITPARRWAGAIDLPPVVGRIARITSGQRVSA